MEWISTKHIKPSGFWSPNHKYLSEEVLICNSCSINIGFWDRESRRWYVDAPARKETIDKITHWMPLPKSPHDA